MKYVRSDWENPGNLSSRVSTRDTQIGKSRIISLFLQSANDVLAS